MERFFAPRGTFPFQGNELFTLFHKWAKLITIAVLAAVIAVARQDRGRISPRISVLEAAYIVTAMAVCVAAVSVLKNMTGVYCPVATTYFGGTHPILDPHSGSLSPRR